MSTKQTDTARAALERLRGKFQAAWIELIEAKKNYDPGSEMRVIAQAQANDMQGVIFEVTKEIEALYEQSNTEKASTSMQCLDNALTTLARHPGSNLYHVKDNDRPMFVLAGSWGEAVTAYEDMVRSENDLEPDEDVEILGVDFVASRLDILVAPIDVEGIKR